MSDHDSKISAYSLFPVCCLCEENLMGNNWQRKTWFYFFFTEALFTHEKMTVADGNLRAFAWLAKLFNWSKEMSIIYFVLSFSNNHRFITTIILKVENDFTLIKSDGFHIYLKECVRRHSSPLWMRSLKLNLQFLTVITLHGKMPGIYIAFLTRTITYTRQVKSYIWNMLSSRSNRPGGRTHILCVLSSSVAAVPLRVI